MSICQSVGNLRTQVVEVPASAFSCAMGDMESLDGSTESAGLSVAAAWDLDEHRPASVHVEVFQKDPGGHDKDAQ